MNILFLTRRFPPYIGGVETHVFEVANELIKKGHRVSVITTSFKHLHPLERRIYQSTVSSDKRNVDSNYPVKSIQTEILASKNTKVFSVDFGNPDILYKLKIWIKMASFAPEFLKADVIHCHDVFFWYLPFRFIFPHKKVYTTFHGYETQYPPKLGAKLIRKISEVLSTGNICVGKYIEKWYGTKADEIVWGGVNSELKNYRIVKKQNYYPSILFLGRLDEDNGLNTYIKALGELKMQKVRYTLRLAGDGKMRKKLEKYGKVLGFLDSNRVIKEIEKADIVFASSYLSILSALALGKRVLSVWENLLKKDYLEMSPFSQYITIASSSTDLVNDFKSTKRVKGGREWACGQTWEKIARIYLKLWQK